jgi:hypothetical protein
MLHIPYINNIQAIDIRVRILLRAHIKTRSNVINDENPVSQMLTLSHEALPLYDREKVVGFLLIICNPSLMV